MNQDIIILVAVYVTCVNCSMSKGNTFQCHSLTFILSRSVIFIFISLMIHIIIIITLFQSSIPKSVYLVTFFVQAKDNHYLTVSWGLVSLISCDIISHIVFYLCPCTYHHFCSSSFTLHLHHHFNEIKDQSLKYTHSFLSIQSFYTCTKLFSYPL